MNMQIYKTYVLLIIISTACDYERNDFAKNELIGSWTYNTYEEPVEKYLKSDTLTMEEFGLSFQSDNTLFRVQLVGGCATPPLDFEKVSGTWVKTSDTTILIEYDNWRGLISDHYLIKNIENNRLNLELLEQKIEKSDK